MPDLDALILGAGPAASALAVHLHRAGATVALLDRPRRPARAPCLVVPVRAARELCALGLGDALARGRPCRGLLTAWDGDEAFHDHELLQGHAAVAIDAQDLRQGLRGATEALGIRVHRATGDPVRRRSGAWELASGSPGADRALRSRALFLGAGRSFATSNLPGLERRHFDRHVALALAARRSSMHADCLVVDASPSGWWYAAPAACEEEHVVFLTDADLLPRDALARRDFVLAELGATRLVRACLTGTPTDARFTGCDARFALATPCPAPRAFAIGDAVLALDPLSGRGVSFAIDSASVASACAAEGDGIAYGSWIWQRFADEWRDRRDTYGRARPPGGGGAYWTRRRASAAPPV